MTTTNAHDEATARLFRCGHYNARDGRGFQPCTSTLSTADSAARDNAAWDVEQDRWAGSLPRFKVGDVIGTREAYEALPVGGTLWPEPRFDPKRFWTREAHGYRFSDGTMATTAELSQSPRVIRSLP